MAVMPAALEVQPGGSARVAITVRLPEGFHMNSDKPRDENLIPITVSMEAVPAVTGATAAFPEPLDLKQEGEPVPLRVFEREFAIGLQVSVAADAAAGAHKLPLRVRYQACDEKQCYLPITAPLELNLSVSANAAAVTPPAQLATARQAGFREGRRRADCRAETRGAGSGCARHSYRRHGNARQLCRARH